MLLVFLLLDEVTEAVAEFGVVALVLPHEILQPKVGIERQRWTIKVTVGTLVSYLAASYGYAHASPSLTFFQPSGKLTPARGHAQHRRASAPC